MYCTKCGSAVAEAATFCGACGEPLAGPLIVTAAPSVSGPPALPPTASGWPAPPPPSAQVYVAIPSPFAGFWLRLVAYIIDSLLTLCGIVVIVLLVAAVVGFGSFRNAFDNADPADDVLTAAIVFSICGGILLIIVGAWLYYAAMESSSYQGTLGKMALGLIVTDLQGRRVTFGRASGRFFAKIITGLIPFALGYVMAGFTEKKQALHDMIASCLVLRKT
jgi:uncharacterized RDD family membrane protein YckC